jgi:hypothetical protein
MHDVTRQVRPQEPVTPSVIKFLRLGIRHVSQLMSLRWMRSLLSSGIGRLCRRKRQTLAQCGFPSVAVLHESLSWMCIAHGVCNLRRVVLLATQLTVITACAKM